MTIIIIITGHIGDVCDCLALPTRRRPAAVAHIIIIIITHTHIIAVHQITRAKITRVNYILLYTRTAEGPCSRPRREISRIFYRHRSAVTPRDDGRGKRYSFYTPRPTAPPATHTAAALVSDRRRQNTINSIAAEERTHIRMSRSRLLHTREIIIIIIIITRYYDYSIVRQKRLIVYTRDYTRTHIAADVATTLRGLGSPFYTHFAPSSL